MTLNFFSQNLIAEVPNFEKLICTCDSWNGLIGEGGAVHWLPSDTAVTVNYGCLILNCGLYWEELTEFDQLSGQKASVCKQYLSQYIPECAIK